MNEDIKNLKIKTLKSIFKDFEECSLTGDHDCWENAQPYEFEEEGHRFHGWECARCGTHLQSG